MMRLLSILFGCLAAGSCLGQSQLVLTRLHDAAFLDEESRLHLDLREYFQYFEAPGPVATFVIDMPELDEGEILLTF